MNLLLDTHVWLWMELAPKRLGPKTRKILENASNDLAFSVASAWEIILKSARGKVELPMEASEYIRTRLKRSGTAVLPIALEHVLALGSLEEQHSDPFDRLLLAQALVESRTLVTADRRLLDYPVLTSNARA